MTNPFLSTKQKAQDAADDRQERNRLWWEEKPMTYADWESAERVPETDADIFEIEAYVQRTGPWLKTWFNSAPLAGLRCVDIGCGSGIFSSMLARKGAHVTSVDLTAFGVNMARRTAQAYDIDLDIVRADVERIPFRDASFDFAFSWGVLHHTSDMTAAVRQMARIVRPQGRGMMMVYHKNSIVYYLHGLFWLICRGKLFAGHSLESVQDFYTDGFYHRYLSAKELSAMLADAGLRTTRISITQYEKKILPMIPRWLDQRLKARFGMCLIAEFEKSSDG